MVIFCLLKLNLPPLSFTVICNFCSNDSIFVVDRILIRLINFDSFFLNCIVVVEDIVIDLVVVHLVVFLFDLSDNLIVVDR